jgi:hypothetical protein
MSATSLPPCGIYRTTQPLNDIPAGKLVYFHNHGNPGAGIYLPQSWTQNRCTFSQNGTPIPGAWWAATLDPLAYEGFYRVREVFHCCEKKCVEFQTDQLVQLGYNGDAEPILFVPELRTQGFHIPESGMRIDRSRISKLQPLKVAVPSSGPTSDAGNVVH